MIIWIFAGKMWAVGWHLKLIKQNRNPKTDDRSLNFIYYLILGINFSSGLFTIYQQLHYKNLLLKMISLLLTLACYTVSCGFFVNAWRNLNTCIQSETIIDMRDFGKFVVAFAMVCVSEVSLLLIIVF
jgi:hypothetical protein